MAQETRESTTTIKASCLCGGARHEISVLDIHLPLRQSFCHCNSCRHMTGTLCLTFADLPPSYRPSPDLIARLTSFNFSKRLTQFFCSTCGSHMLARNWINRDDQSKGEQWDVMTGSLLGPIDDILEVGSHDFVADTLDGGFADFLPTVDEKQIPRWAGKPAESELLPLYWRTSTSRISDGLDHSSPSPAGEKEDKLHAHCKCHGVQFWISRPSERSKNASSPIADLLIPDHDPASKSYPPTSPWWLRNNGSKFLAGVCACNSCRLDTGMEWMEWAFIPAVDISLDEQGRMPLSLPFGTLKGHKSSPKVVRYHCSTCGATVFFTSSERDGLVDVAVGLLDASEGARCERWLEFETGRVSFREDAIGRAKGLTLGLEKGMRDFEVERVKSERRGMREQE